MFVFYLQTVKTRPEMVYILPSQLSLLSQTARETLEENVETNDPYVVDVKFDIADVEW